MKRVLLVMKRRVLAEAIMQETQSALLFRAEYRSENAPIAAETFAADVVLLEIPERTPRAQSAALCDAIKRQRPETRILLLCPENDPDACRVTIEAVREKRADDFVFYDTSIRFLLSKLEML